jgi:hypothetical protein
MARAPPDYAPKRQLQARGQTGDEAVATDVAGQTDGSLPREASVLPIERIEELPVSDPEPAHELHRESSGA